MVDPEDIEYREANQCNYVAGDECHKCRCMCANLAELLAEDIEVLHMNLDSASVPRDDGNGNTYSLWGRVQIYKTA